MHRRLLIILLGVLLTIAARESVVAQERYLFQDSLGTYRVDFRPHNVKSAEFSRKGRIRTNLAGNHEVRFGMAYNPYTTHGFTSDVDWLDYPTDNPANTTIAPSRWVTINGDYGYWFYRWLYVGVSATWAEGFQRVSSTVDHRRVDCYNFHGITIMPIVRFAWLNRGIVQLYSGVGLGPMVSIYESKLYSKPATRWGCNYDVTFIGITVGSKWFGYLDVGVGGRGIVSAGLGYRFVNGSKR